MFLWLMVSQALCVWYIHTHLAREICTFFFFLTIIFLLLFLILEFNGDCDWRLAYGEYSHYKNFRNISVTMFVSLKSSCCSTLLTYKKEVVQYVSLIRLKVICLKVIS